MFDKIRNIDGFGRNIIIVFAGSTALNILSLLYQLLVAHRLRPEEFAAFNSLLAVFMVASSPLSTLQLAVAKYSAQFSARREFSKIKYFFSDIFIKILVFSVSSFLFLIFASRYLLPALKIHSFTSGILLALLIVSSWFVVFFTGAVQGLEYFKWLTASNVASGAAKLAFAFYFIYLGFNVSGAIAALLLANIIAVVIFYYPLRGSFSFRLSKEEIDYKEIFVYLFPVALANFCFVTLSSLDMVLVKYFFDPEQAGIYSLGQMAGKIFLFLPGSISLVLFPRSSHLHAKNLDTLQTLKRSLAYAAVLCALAAAFYNLFPAFVLNTLTGKSNPASILLGRFFSVSMSFFALSFILISYFLSIKKLNFIKYPVFFLLLQVSGICLFHAGLIQVQLVICINAVLLFIFLAQDARLFGSLLKRKRNG